MSEGQQQEAHGASAPTEEGQEQQQQQQQSQQPQEQKQQQQQQHEPTKPAESTADQPRPLETRGTSDRRTETRGSEDIDHSQGEAKDNEAKGNSKDQSSPAEVSHTDDSKKTADTPTKSKGEHSNTKSSPAHAGDTKAEKKGGENTTKATTKKQNTTDTKTTKSKTAEKNTKSSSHSGEKTKGDKSENKSGAKGLNTNKQKTPKKGETEGEHKEEVSKKEEAHAENGNTTQRSSDSMDMSEGRHRQKEFFKLELQRLETGLRRESSKIRAPEQKAYTPYVFNTLAPYYNTYTTRFLIELPDEVEHGHTSRKTAQGLTDPWLDLKMDRELPPLVSSRAVSRQVAILKREKEIRDRKKRSAASQSSPGRKGGSTRLPKFPVVNLETRDLATKQLYYSDVPALRHELKTKYSSSAQAKVAEDYTRTQQDFYRMELDKLDEVHPINRKHMTSAYMAYLQNTPGSKKAITECVRGLRSGKA